MTEKTVAVVEEGTGSIVVERSLRITADLPCRTLKKIINAIVTTCPVRCDPCVKHLLNEDKKFIDESAVGGRFAIFCSADLFPGKERFVSMKELVEWGLSNGYDPCLTSDLLAFGYARAEGHSLADADNGILFLVRRPIEEKAALGLREKTKEEGRDGGPIIKCHSADGRFLSPSKERFLLFRRTMDDLLIQQI